MEEVEGRALLWPGYVLLSSPAVQHTGSKPRAVSSDLRGDEVARPPLGSGEEALLTVLFHRWRRGDASGVWPR